MFTWGMKLFKLFLAVALLLAAGCATADKDYVRNHIASADSQVWAPGPAVP